MAIDVHAHYVPSDLLQRLRTEGSRLGVEVVDVVAHGAACQCLRFADGLQSRPLFSKLVESPQARVESMAAQGIDRQILSGWVDLFAPALSGHEGVGWHRLMNECLAATCAEQPQHFSMLASGHMPDAAQAARELEHAVRHFGALGGIVACNIDGMNPGEMPLDEYWAAASELDVPVFLHPTQPVPTARSRAFALNQVVQYTFDTTLAIGSLMWSGVLDRFPKLRLILSHGGGALPYLLGRFDVMDRRSDRAASGIASTQLPSAYAARLHYDTILHSAPTLRFLAQSVGFEQIVLGTDDGFPPADRTPLQSLAEAGFSLEEMAQIVEKNPRRLFRLG